MFLRRYGGALIETSLPSFALYVQMNYMGPHQALGRVEVGVGGVDDPHDRRSRRCRREREPIGDRRCAVVEGDAE